MWTLPRPRIKPVSPALAGGFLTTVPPRSPSHVVLNKESYFFLSNMDAYFFSCLIALAKTFSTVLTRSGEQKYPWFCSSKSERRNTSALLTIPKSLTVWITTNCGKFLKRWKYQNTLPASWEICMQVKKQQLEPDMEQRTGSKLGKKYIKAVCCHPAYLTYMQSTSCKMPG